MASSTKRKTTMAKLARERKLQERRLEKEARRDERRLRAAEPASGPDAVEPPEAAGGAPAEDDGPAA